MKFLLPSRIPQYDFQYQVIASQDYWQNFQNTQLEIAYVEDYPVSEFEINGEKWKKYCPVGSLEFCHRFGINTIPRNIPPQLIPYAVGCVTNNITQRHLDGISKWHVKSSTVIKHPENGVYSLAKLPSFDDYQAVEWLADGFDAEFRIFVSDGQIVDMQNYSGDLWTVPDRYTVEHMIHDFEYAPGFNCPPPAYTLDVGVYSGKTYVIEVHDFYSCGTYNFNDHYRLPIMLRNWYNWYLKLAIAEDDCHSDLKSMKKDLT